MMATTVVGLLTRKFVNKYVRKRNTTTGTVKKKTGLSRIDDSPTTTAHGVWERGRSLDFIGCDDFES